MSSNQDVSDELRNELEEVLGLDSTSKATDPYMNYIKNRRIGSASLEQYLRLFILVIQFFRYEAKTAKERSIISLIDSLVDKPHEYFLHPQHGKSPTHTDVEDTVMYIIGTWTLLRSSFVRLPIADGARKIVLVYAIATEDFTTRHKSYRIDVAGLLAGSRLLPTGVSFEDLTRLGSENAKFTEGIGLLRKAGPLAQSMLSNGALHGGGRPPTSSIDTSLRILESLESLESLHIAAIRLNAYTLSTFAAIEVIWSHNVSRHLLLSMQDGRQVLELFADPALSMRHL